MVYDSTYPYTYKIIFACSFIPDLSILFKGSLQFLYGEINSVTICLSHLHIRRSGLRYINSIKVIVINY